MEHHLFHFQQKKKSLSLLFLLIFNNNTLGIGQQYHSLFLFPVHLGHYRMFKMDMAQVFSLMHSRLRIQEVLIVYSVVHKSIDRDKQELRYICYGKEHTFVPSDLPETRLQLNLRGSKH